MRITKILGLDEYYHDPQFAAKKPDLRGSWKERCGDNFYSRAADGTWIQHRNRFHLDEGMNYPAASCEVSNPRLRTPGSRQFGGGILVWHVNLRTTPTGRLGDAVAHSLFHCLAAAHTGE